MNDTPKTAAVETSHWTLDKRIPLALLVTLGFQTIAVVIWGSTLTSDVGRLKDDQARALARVDRTEQATTKLDLVQYRLDQVDQRTARIEAKLDAASGN